MSKIGNVVTLPNDKIPRLRFSDSLSHALDSALHLFPHAAEHASGLVPEWRHHSLHVLDLLPIVLT